MPSLAGGIPSTPSACLDDPSVPVGGARGLPGARVRGEYDGRGVALR
jgi:hypothetical protein